MPQPVFETALVSGCSLLPGVGPEPVESVVLVLSLVGVPVGEPFFSLPVLEGVHQHSTVGGIESSKYPFAVHNSQFPESMVNCAMAVKVESFFVTEPVCKESFEGPFVEQDFSALVSFDIVAEGSLEPAHSGLQVEPFAVPFVALHHSFIDVPVFEDEDGLARTLSIQKLPDIKFMRTESHDLQFLLAPFHLLDKPLIQGTISRWPHEYMVKKLSILWGPFSQLSLKSSG